MKISVCHAFALLVLLAAHAPAEETLQCRLERGRLLAPMTIAGQAGFTALLDAGIQAPLLSTQALASLGIDAEAQKSPINIAFSPTLALNLEAATGDLAFLSERLGVTVDALFPLQQPGLELTLDAAAGSVTYRPLGAAELAARVGGVASLRLRDGVAPLAQVLIDGKYQREVEIDLAFPGVIALGEETANALGLFAKNPPALRTFNAARESSVQFRLGILRLGSTDLEAPICELGGKRDRLGLAALQHFRLTLNYEAGLMRWAPRGNAFIPRQELTGYGMVLDRLRAGQWELGVSENSPAAEAGVKPGALLVGINGAPIQDTSHATLGRMLRAIEGDTTEFNLLQQGVARTVTLTAKPLL